MPKLRISSALFLLLSAPTLHAKTLVFWQDGFPSVETPSIARESLERALQELSPTFSNLDELKNPAALNGSDLLVLPYGSSFPAEAWSVILAGIRRGANLVVIGGQPFRVPVRTSSSKFVQEHPQDTYSRELGILHTYAVPQSAVARFRWKFGYSFLPPVRINAQKFFALEGRQLDGLGYMLDSESEKVAAPVVVSSHTQAASGEMLGSRWVFLDFAPNAGYWDSQDGVSLIRTAAAYASAGATSFSLETQYATLKPNEMPQVTVHLRDALRQKKGLAQDGHVTLELLSGDTILAKSDVPWAGEAAEANITIQKTLAPGFYTVRGTYKRDGKPREFYQSGFWVKDDGLLRSGPVLAVRGDFLSRDGKPFFPFGTNYFTTEENGWDFSGSRNAYVWERDFAEMESHGISFVRTGVWNGQLKFLDDAEGGVGERFLRNLEAYLLSARRHKIAVNFTLIPNSKNFIEKQIGSGKVLFAALYSL